MSDEFECGVRGAGVRETGDERQNGQTGRADGAKD
jgi:hypothetical protein